MFNQHMTRKLLGVNVISQSTQNYVKRKNENNNRLLFMTNNHEKPSQIDYEHIKSKSVVRSVPGAETDALSD